LVMRIHRSDLAVIVRNSPPIVLVDPSVVLVDAALVFTRSCAAPPAGCIRPHYAGSHDSHGRAHVSARRRPFAGPPRALAGASLHRILEPWVQLVTLPGRTYVRISRLSPSN